MSVGNWSCATIQNSFRKAFYRQKNGKRIIKNKKVTWSWNWPHYYLIYCDDSWANHLCWRSLFQLWRNVAAGNILLQLLCWALRRLCGRGWIKLSIIFCKMNYWSNFMKPKIIQIMPFMIPFTRLLTKYDVPWTLLW